MIWICKHYLNKIYLFFISLVFINYLLHLYMLKTKTIRIDEKLHEAAKFYVTTLGISGGFSAYVQSLIINDFKKNGMKLPKEDTK